MLNVKLQMLNVKFQMLNVKPQMLNVYAMSTDDHQITCPQACTFARG